MVAEIAIVGAGPSGLSFAACCERKGLSYVLYERVSEDTPPRGGCLDLHVGSGQLAMNEAGVFEEFRKYARGGDATIHRVYDHEGNEVFSWGAGRDSPELDRDEIKKVLLTGIPKEKVIWNKAIESSSRDSRGRIVLKFTDQTTATGFKLVVGADGTFSKIRRLITPVNPKYWGAFFFAGAIPKSNAFFDKMYEKVGDGPMVTMGRSLKCWIQLQGDGHFAVSLGFIRPHDFATAGPIDSTDVEAVKNLMLSEEFYGHHSQFIKDAIAAMEGPIYNYTIWEMPVEALNWKASKDVTLIGDAAHATSPFVGDGANCAMRDAVILARNLERFGISQESIAAYEEEMFPLAKEMIKRSNMSGRLFFEWDAPKGFVEAMKSINFIGATDEY